MILKIGNLELIYLFLKYLHYECAAIFQMLNFQKFKILIITEGGF